MSKRTFKKVTYKQYKFGFATRVSSKFKDIPKWGKLLVDTTMVASPVVHAKISGDTIEIEYHPDTIDENTMTDKMKIQIEGIIKTFLKQHEGAKEVLLNEHFIPLAFKVDFSRWVAIESITELFEPLTIEEIYEFAKKEPSKGKAFFRLFAIGNTMFFMSSSTLDMALTAVILNDYCYNDIAPAPKGQTFEKVSPDGFYWLFTFLTLLCGHSKPTQYTLKEMYSDSDKYNFVPNIPITFNDEHMKLKVDTLAQYAFEQENETNGDEKMVDDTDVGILTKEDFEDEAQFPLALGEAYDSENLEHGTDYFSLFKLLNNDVEDHELLFIYADEYPVIVDCDINLGKTTLKQEEIKGAILNSGILEMAIDDASYSDKEIDKLEIELEKALDKLFMDGVMIYKESSKMGIKIKDDTATLGKALM